MEENKQKHIAEDVSDEELSKVTGGTNSSDPLCGLKYLNETASVEEIVAMLKNVQMHIMTNYDNVQVRKRLENESLRLMLLYQDKKIDANKYYQGANTFIR